MAARELTFEMMKTPGKRVINRKQLLQKVPLSERTIYDMEKEGKFPKRFALSTRLVVWDLDEVDAWIQQQKEAGATPAAPGKKAA